MGKGRAATALEMQLIQKKEKKQYQVKTLTELSRDDYVRVYGEKAYANYQANSKKD